MSMFSNLPLSVILLIVTFALACAGGLYAVLAERQRRAVMRRAMGGADVGALYRKETATRGLSDLIVDWMVARVPVQFGDNTATASKLVRAGFDGGSAPAMFALTRVATAVSVPALALLITPRNDQLVFIGAVSLAVMIGLLGPQAALDRLSARRQDVIRKGIPDALDLLVVCVEAGVALDAAVQRVARELNIVHPILSDELVGMSRRISAGMPRDQAMQGLYLRTGLDELRGLASHMMQSEKWGTSIAAVLRVYGDQLRKKRKMAAEKRAATAGTRMLIPLALFIFPTIFIVLLGPAAVQISGMFDQMGK